VTTPPIRRDEIMGRAAELFARKGIAGTTVRDIGEVTGLLSGSLYHHFRSKHAIVSEILTRYLGEIHARFTAVVERSRSPEETIRGLILETLRVIEENPHPAAIYQNDRRYLRDHGMLDQTTNESRQVRRYWLDAIEAGVTAGIFRDDIPAEIVYRTVRDTLWATVHWPNRGAYSTEAFAALMVDLFFAGFARERAHQTVTVRDRDSRRPPDARPGPA